MSVVQCVCNIIILILYYYNTNTNIILPMCSNDTNVIYSIMVMIDVVMCAILSDCWLCVCILCNMYVYYCVCAMSVCVLLMILCVKYAIIINYY